MSAVISSPSPTVRSMLDSDLDVVVAIEREIHPFPWTKGIFQDCMRVGYLCHVLERDGSLDGYGVMSVAAGESHILNLSVRREAQRSGLGRSLLGHLIDQAGRRGCATMFLEVRPSNQAAIRLYESEGFSEIGVRGGYYPATHGREDALILARELSRTQ